MLPGRGICILRPPLAMAAGEHDSQAAADRWEEMSSQQVCEATSVCWRYEGVQRNRDQIGPPFREHETSSAAVLLAQKGSFCLLVRGVAFVPV